MNKAKILGKSVSILVVAFIAITAFTKEPLRLILLVCALATWAIYLACVGLYR